MQRPMHFPIPSIINDIPQRLETGNGLTTEQKQKSKTELVLQQFFNITVHYINKTELKLV
jgi:hypothetical protein